MDEEIERDPIVVIPKAPGDLKVGDYVFASRWSDADPGDPWAVGHVSEVIPPVAGWGGVVVGDSPARFRVFPRAMKITQEQGKRIIEMYPPMERKPLDYDFIAKVFNGD